VVSTLCHPLVTINVPYRGLLAVEIVTCFTGDSDGCSGVVVSTSRRGISDLKVGGSTPSPCNRVVFLDKKLYPTLSLSTQVYKWVLATYCWG